MDLIYLKERLIQENIVLREVLQEVKTQVVPGANWFPSPLPYPGYTTPPRFGFMSTSMVSKLEMLTQPLI